MPTPPPSVHGGGVASSSPSPRRIALFLVLILAAAALVRVPALYNSQASFNSDEAVDALVLQHMLHGGGITLFNWDAKYYGIVESLLSLPFLAAGIAIPLASRLGSLVAFLLLPLAVHALGRRLYGARTGLLAAALLIAFSPRVVLWSVLASGGYGLVVAWGSLTLVQYDRLRRQPTAANTALFGLMAGFGFYIYELFLVYLATFAAAWIAGWLPPRLGPRISASAARREDGASSLRRSGGEPDRREPAAPVGTALARGALLLGAFAVGWLPKLALLLGGGAIGAKRPAYRLATRHVMAGNLELLSDCVCSFLGVNPSRRPNVEALAGDAWTLSWLVGGVLLAVYAVAWGSAARRAVLSRTRPAGAAPAGPLPTEAVLVLLVPVTALLFVASPNPAGPLADHYLLPMLSSLPLLAATLLARIRRRTPRAAWALAALLLVLPLIQVTRWYRMRGDLGPGPGLDLRRAHSDLEQIVAYLDRQGIRAAYGDYWTSYRTTLMSGERIVVAPLTDWDRYPPFTRLAAAAPTEAYIFVDPRQAADLGFPGVLAAAGRRYTTARFGNYVVYTSPDHQRLLPPPATPELLLHPRARLEARVPGAVRAGAGLDLPVTVRNDGDAAWSALGQLATHIFRVDVSYHWLDAGGHDVVFEGDRSFLPHDLPPGAAEQLTAHVPAPAIPGRYRLCLTVVQEGALWFDQAGAGAAYFDVDVTPAAGPGR